MVKKEDEQQVTVEAAGEEDEGAGWLWQALQTVLCWREGHSCCCCCGCCCCGEDDTAQRRKADIKYILQRPDEPSSDTTSLVSVTQQQQQHGEVSGRDSLSDTESLSTTSLLRHQSNSSSQSSSVSSVKDIKSDIYHQIELRRSNSISSRQLPVIDVRPIEFWSGVRGEGVQPRLPGPPRSPMTPRWASTKTNDHEALTKIRPQLYTSTSSSLEEGSDEDTLGRIHFSLRYDASTAVLLVKVLEAVDIPRPACKDRNDLAHSNPYVKVALLPDSKNSRQTSVKKKTQDPLFEETFSFELPYREVTRRTLELKVKDFDKYSRHCVVGRVLLPLSSINLARPARLWRPLVHCGPETEEYGEVLLSLNYLPTAGRLNIDVIKAKQILQTNLVRGADPYIRVSLVVRGRHLKSKKTSVKRNTLAPAFNESFSFHVAAGELREASLVVTAWDWNGGVMRDEFIGRIVLGKQPSGVFGITCSPVSSKWVAELLSMPLRGYHNFPEMRHHLMCPAFLHTGFQTRSTSDLWKTKEDVVLEGMSDLGDLTKRPREIVQLGGLPLGTRANPHMIVELSLKNDD